MGSPSPVHSRDSGAGSKHSTSQPARAHRVPRQRHKPPARARRGHGLPPDLPAIARQAVVTYLHQAAERPAEAEETGSPIAQARSSGTDVVQSEAAGGVLAAGRPMDTTPQAGLAAAGSGTAQEVAVRAAQLGLATLDRIEAAAAALEADIAAARSEQARLQAGAGKAAADAIKAAEAAWTAAGSAEESSRRASLSLRMVMSWVIIAAILVVIQLVIVLVFAASAH